MPVFLMFWLEEYSERIRQGKEVVWYRVGFDEFSRVACGGTIFGFVDERYCFKLKQLSYKKC